MTAARSSSIFESDGTPRPPAGGGHVFLSYSRGDVESARRLASELRSAGLSVWFDLDSLLPGQRWQREISEAIRTCDCFVALMSSNSVNKRGFAQRELRQALDLLEQFPDSGIFVIPVRLDDCSPSQEKLLQLQWVDLFGNWEGGKNRIVEAIRAASPGFVGLVGASTAPADPEVTGHSTLAATPAVSEASSTGKASTSVLVGFLGGHRLQAIAALVILISGYLTISGALQTLSWPPIMDGGTGQTLHVDDPPNLTSRALSGNEVQLSLDQTVAVALVIDNSASMAETDPAGLSLAVAERFVNGINLGSQIVLVTFASTAQTLIPTTTIVSERDRDAFTSALRPLRPSGGTDFLAALEKLDDELSSARIVARDRFAVLITDGEPSPDGWAGMSEEERLEYVGRIDQAINLLGDRSIRVFAVSIGRAVDRGLLTRLTERTGGQYVEALSAYDLQEVYSAVMTSVQDRR